MTHKKDTPKFGYLFIFFSIGLISAHGQSGTKPPFLQSLSFMTGGMIIGKSSLWVNKFSAERNHIGFLIDLTRDTYREKWSDDSGGKYRLLSISGAGRYYLKPYARSLFAEIAMGWAAPKLTVHSANDQERMVGNFGAAGWGAGWRFGKRNSKFFGEAGFRSVFPLKTVHLYSGFEPLPGSTKENITYQSWYFEKLKSTSQFYLGIGHSFRKK